MKNLEAYLTFDGNCREAIEFYQSCLGGEMNIMTFAGTPMEEQMPSEAKDNVMHAVLKIDGKAIMASDGMPGQSISKGNNIQLSVDCSSEEEQDRFFKALAAGGEVEMPIQHTFWGTRFAMLTDKFGVRWMLSFDEQSQQA